MPYRRLFLAACASACSLGAPAIANASFSLTLNPIGTYRSGIYDEGGAQIVAYDASNRRTETRRAPRSGSTMKTMSGSIFSPGGYGDSTKPRRW